MKLIFHSLALLLALSSKAFAGIDDAINSATAPIAEVIGKIVFFKVPFFGAQLPMVVLWLVVGAVFFTVYMRFINIRGFAHAISLVKGDYADPKAAVRFLTSRLLPPQSRVPSASAISAVWRLR